MSRVTVRTPLAALLLAALLLAGCGGGSDDSVTKDAHSLLQHELDTALADIARLTSERDTALARVQKLEDELEQAGDDLDGAQAALATARADLARVQGQLTEAQRQLGVAETERDAAQQQAEDAQQQAEDAQREADQRLADAETQAVVDVRAPLLIGVLSGTLNEAAGAGVTHAPGGRRTFTRPNNLPAKGSAPSVPGGWASASYSGPRGAVGTDTVYIYTNIQAPGSKAFWKEHGESVTGLTGAFSGLTETATTGSFGNDRSLYQDNADPPQPVNRDNVSRGGTYDGYSGTFSCADTCNIAADAQGALTFVGTWTFTAGLTAKRSSSHAEQDTEFLYFGIWAFDPTDPADATNVHDFDWVGGGDTNAGDDAIGNFDALTGTATFTGGAVGRYALAKVGGREAQIGTFTATANFTADFDTGPDGSAGNSLSGRITDFKEGGSSLGSDWHVFLGSSASAAATLAATGTTGTLQAHGSIDGDTATGSWAATLHGSNNVVLTDRVKYPVSSYPVADLAGVAGWFNAAAGTNAAIAGAFGAACPSSGVCIKQ